MKNGMYLNVAYKFASNGKIIIHHFYGKIGKFKNSSPRMYVRKVIKSSYCTNNNAYSRKREKQNTTDEKIMIKYVDLRAARTLHGDTTETATNCRWHTLRKHSHKT